MSWTLVQSVKFLPVAGYSGGQPVTLSATAAGNLLVVEVGQDQRVGTVAVSDNKTQSYGTGVTITSSSGAQHAIFWVKTVAGVTQVTVTPSAFSATYFVVNEWQPPAGYANPAFDVGHALQNTDNTSPCLTGTTAAISDVTDLLLCIFSNDIGITGNITFSTPTGYTPDQSGQYLGVNGGFVASYYNLTPSAGAQQASVTTTPASTGRCMGMIAAFKVTASASPVGAGQLGVTLADGSSPVLSIPSGSSADGVIENILARGGFFDASGAFHPIAQVKSFTRGS